MQLAPPTVTQPFSILYSEHDANSATLAGERVTSLAQDHGVELTNLVVGPAVYESMPPQGDITGEFTGSTDAVQQALAAIELLDAEI